MTLMVHDSHPNATKKP